MAPWVALVLVPVGTAFAGLQWWKRETRKRLEHSKLNVLVERDSSKAAVPVGLVAFLELDPDVAAAPPLDGVRLLSLGSYFASLSPRGSVSFERALVSIADRWGLAAALPLAMFLPPPLRAEGDAAALLAGFPTLAAGRFSAAAVSSLDLVAFSHTVNKFLARKRKDKGCDATDGDGGRAHAAGQGGGERAAKTQPGQQQQQKEEEEDEEDGGHNQQQQAPAKRRRLLFWRRGPPPAAAPAAEAPGAPERAADDALRRGGPLDLLRRGGAAGDPSVTRVPPPEQLPNPLLLTREAVRALLRITEEELADVAPAPVPEAARKLHPLLPDLYLGDGPGSDSGGGGDGQGGGLHLTHGAAAAAVCNLMATVFNRLVANSLCDASWAAGAPPPRFAASQSFREPAAASSVDEAVAGPQSGGASSEAGGGSGRFGVCLQEGGPVYYSQEELVDALAASGHSVDIELVSSLTSFGVGLSVHTPDGGWQHIPMAFPLSTGLWAPGGDAAGSQDVTTLISHASIRLRCRGPALDFDLEYCLAVAGFTGWLSFAQPARPWLLGWEFTPSHPLSPGGGPPGPVSDPAARARLLRLLAASAAALNAAAQRGKLLLGGYGLLGVCLDSVAAVQQAVAGECTLYPLLLGGAAKAGLISLYQEAAAAGWAYADEACALAAALAALPCDALPEPAAAAGAARRALACLPERSVFAAAGPCRRRLQEALAAAEALAAGMEPSRPAAVAGPEAA